MKTNYLYILLLVFFIPILCQGQNCYDTLDYKEFVSDQIFVFFKSEKELFRKIGKPDKTLKRKRKIIIFEEDGFSTVVDTIIYSKVVWYSKYAAIYDIFENSVRLQSVDFRKTKFSIVHKNVILNSGTTFDELEKLFPCSTDSVELSMSPFAFENNVEFENMIKTINLNTGESHRCYLRLYFNKNKLLYLELDI